MDISNKNFIIATHELVYGAPQALRDYLEMENSNHVTYISHPLMELDKASYVEVRKEGSERERYAISNQWSIPVLTYFLQGARSALWGLRYGGRADLYVGVNPLNTIGGLILRCISRTKKVVYFTIDFSPIRFNSPILNWTYHTLDRLCVAWSDEVWNVSPRIVDGREKLHGSKAPPKGHQKVVPIGVWFDRVRRKPFEQVKRHQVLFLGHLLEKQGVQLIIDAIPKIVQKVPDFHFLIIGGGEYEEVLRKKVIDIDVAEHVTFMGWINDREKIDQLMANCAIAVATYIKDIANFTAYADPTKLKDYLSAALPIVMTDVAHNASELQSEGCAVIVEAQKDAISQIITELLTNDEMLRTMKENAIKYIKQFDWPEIFSKNLIRLIK